MAIKTTSPNVRGAEKESEKLIQDNVSIQTSATSTDAIGSHQMKSERCPINLADIGLNGFPAQTLMRCVSMATIKAVELTFKLDKINWLLKTNLTDTFY